MYSKQAAFIDQIGLRKAKTLMSFDLSGCYTVLLNAAHLCGAILRNQVGKEINKCPTEQ